MMTNKKRTTEDHQLKLVYSKDHAVPAESEDDYGLPPLEGKDKIIYDLLDDVTTLSGIAQSLLEENQELKSSGDKASALYELRTKSQDNARLIIENDSLKKEIARLQLQINQQTNAAPLTSANMAAQYTPSSQKPEREKVVLHAIVYGMWPAIHRLIEGKFRDNQKIRIDCCQEVDELRRLLQPGCVIFNALKFTAHLPSDIKDRHTVKLIQGGQLKIVEAIDKEFKKRNRS